MILYADLACFWRILAILGRFGALEGSKEDKCYIIVKPKSILCREAIEERNFTSQFWDLRSTVFSAVNCVGFLRSRRTHLDHFVINLKLL
jgi:hypothetical protein